MAALNSLAWFQALGSEISQKKSLTNLARLFLLAEAKLTAELEEWRRKAWGSLPESEPLER